MDIETIQARIAYIPSIDAMVRLVTLEPPNNFADVNRDDTPEVENALRDLAQTIFGVPSQHVVTYSKWHSTSETLRTKINSEVFKTQMRQAYAGNDEKLGKAFDEKRHRFETFLSVTSSTIPDVKAFAGCMFRNLILNGNFMSRPTFKEISGFAEYSEFVSIPQSLYFDFTEQGTDEILLANWTAVSAAVNTKVLPRVKEAERALIEYEVPFAGSPKSEKLTIKGLQAATRGCAAIPLAGVAQNLYTVVTTGHYALLLFVPIGVLGVVLFLAITPLIPELERYLSRTFKNALNPVSSSKKGAFQTRG